MIHKDLIIGETNADYHAHPSISSTQVKTFLKSRQLFKDTQDGIVKPKSSAAYSLGTAIHTYFLERADFHNQIAVSPADHKGNTKDGKAWKKAALEEGKTIITYEELENIKLMALRMPPVIAGIFKEGAPEVGARTVIHGVNVQARFDWLSDYLWDIKSTADLEQLATKDCYKFGYHISGAWYEMVHEAVTGVFKEWRIIAIEKAAPFRSQIMHLDREMIDEAKKGIKAFFTDYTRCIETGEWCDDTPYLREDKIDLPTWVYKQMDGEG